MAKPSSGISKILVLLIGLAVLRGLLYSAIIPPWQAPDETSHFEYMRLLYEKRRLLSCAEDRTPFLERAIILSLYEHNFWRYIYRQPPEPLPSSLWDIPFLQEVCFLDRPSLAYLVGALFLAPVSSQGLVVQLYSTRIASVLLGGLVVWIAYKATREIFPDDDFLALIVPAFITFLPMQTYIYSSANDTPLATVFASAAIYFLLRTSKRGVSFSDMLGYILMVTLALWTKATTLFLVPLTVVTMPFCLVRSRRETSSASPSRNNILLLGAIIALVLVATRYSPSYSVLAAFIPHVRHPFSGGHFSPQALTRYPAAFVSTFVSFWGVFGWMALPVNPLFYKIAAALVLMSAAGLIRLALEITRGRAPQGCIEGRVLSILAASAFLAMASLVGFTVCFPEGIYYGQGRYLFPAVLPVAVLFILGLRHWLPYRRRRLVPTLIICSLFLFDTLCLMDYLLPFFYGRR